MTPLEQQALFARAQKHFPEWLDERVSGYVHGVKDCLAGRNEPRSQYFNTFDPYAEGYMRGFIDAFGIGVAHTTWGLAWGYTSAGTDYRWWDKEDE